MNETCGCYGTVICRICQLRGVSRFPPKRTRLDNSRLITGLVEEAFNASMIRYQDHYLLAYRTGWEGSQVHVCRLNDQFEPEPSQTLNLTTPFSPFGREDPRLFWYAGRLHVSFIGVLTGQGPTSQLYARLRDDLTVEAIYYPEYAARQPWEKNWSFFEFEGELFAVYESGPSHKILKIEGNRATLFAETPNLLEWTGGHLRGGAPPVRVGEHFYHWTHGRIGDWSESLYTVGLSVFEARPPFRVVRQVPTPLAIGDRSLIPANQASCYPGVVFPGGAILAGDRWLITCGIQDRWIEILEWKTHEIEELLSGPPKVRGECQHLGRRTEFRPGCSGWMCAHECDLGQPVAVPGDHCQRCELWEE